MRSRTDLFPHQVAIVQRMVAARQLAVFVAPGLGKTGATLTALVDLGSPRTLVVAPARVTESDVWGREAASWEHTKHLRVVPLVGIPKKRNAALALASDVDVVSYELFPWLSETVDLDKRYGAVVWDELSKMKHPGSVRFRRMRTRASEIPIRFGLTGTPRGNHLRDLWGEMFAVAGAAPLGPTKTGFDMTYFTAIQVGANRFACSWSMKPGAEALVFERLKPWAVSIQSSAAPTWKLRFNDLHVPLPLEVRKLSQQLASEMAVTLANGTELTAMSAGALASKVRQMAGGAVYTSPPAWAEVHDEKLEALAGIVDELQGEPTLVCYWYKHEAERILKRFPGARKLACTADIDAWNRGEVEMLLLHPASAGHGLNLQFGGHTLVWYTLPWSLELWQQTLGRLTRPGQKSSFVMVHTLLAGDADQAVASILRDKDAGQQRLLDYVR